MDKLERIEKLKELQALEMGQEMVWDVGECDKGALEYFYITRVPTGFIWKVDKYAPITGEFIAMSLLKIDAPDFFNIPDDYFNTESPDYVYKNKEIIENE